jgi:aspartate carbamoyltransferase regulatory subunit
MANRYAHVLLFECPECILPIAISRISKDKNLEKIDSERIRLRCSYCDESFDVHAVDAKRHYVEDWE